MSRDDTPVIKLLRETEEMAFTWRGQVGRLVASIYYFPQRACPYLLVVEGRESVVASTFLLKLEAIEAAETALRKELQAA